MITINEAPLNRRLIVRSFHTSEERDYSEIEARLMLLGFLEGQIVIVAKKAPLYKEPLLVEVRSRMIALSCAEASLIKVEVLQ